MNNCITIKDSNKFQEIINLLENALKRVQNVIDSENKNVELINETDVWSGPSARSMYRKYRELNSNYVLIDYSLDLYVRFLKKTLEDYRRIEAEISKNTDEMASNLDVNA